tara:strand:- start:586 stop:1617 length:1032 start_codon:yes stop_codon:yes gene_type:complete
MSIIELHHIQGLCAEEHRAIRIILDSIDRLELSLSGLTVLTEVGTNYYLYTPIIAALAGAKRVYAWTGDTPYGLGSETIKKCKELAKKLDVLDRIEFSNNKQNIQHIESANIITNSGFLRPIDKNFLRYVNSKKCVVSLMFEAWEFRESDLDLQACRKANIKVAGTWENHPSIKVFNATGHLAVKLIMEAGFEVYGNNIAVWSADDFGITAAKELKSLAATSVLLTADKTELISALPQLDFIYFCDYAGISPLIGSGGILEFDDIKDINPSLGIVHLFGDLDLEECSNHGLRVYPHKNGCAQVMTETLAYLGPEPSLKLTIAGFKVGQSLISGDDNDLCQVLS